MSRPTAPVSAAHPASPGGAWHRPMLVCAAVMAVCAVVSTIGVLADDRVLVGAPIWLKPLKFALSIGIYSVTWAWLFSLLRGRRRLAHRVSTVIVGVALVEYAVIVTQVVRGTTSHFNLSTPLNTALWGLMGSSIIVLWVGTLVLTLLLLRTPIADAATRWSVRLGTVLSLIGLALGGLMLGPTPEQRAQRQAGTGGDVLGAHSVGVADGGPGMPLTGWSTTGGDLRIPHFVGMHALQVLPLLALGLGVWARRRHRLADPVVRTRIVLVAGGVYAGLVALVTWQALRGQPFVAPDAATLAAFAALVAGG
ncbi:hypothetical protein, partial [Saccharomonospora saliphila]|uniref:hypothetical protein n=1 Tax=Saccharomonospora saliphila TaxID=369829 RepID=UPI0009FC54C4